MPPIIPHSRRQSFFPRFYQHHFDATLFTLFSDELTSRHERKTPWKLRENCIWFFSSHILNGSAGDESAPSPFSVNISSGLNEFTLIGKRHIVAIINAYGSPPSYTCILIHCTKRPHVFFFYEVVHYNDFDFALWMSHRASFIVDWAVFSRQKSQHIVIVWTLSRWIVHFCISHSFLKGNCQ